MTLVKSFFPFVREIKNAQLLADVVIDRPWNKEKIQFCLQENGITLDTISLQNKNGIWWKQNISSSKFFLV